MSNKEIKQKCLHPINKFYMLISNLKNKSLRIQTNDSTFIYSRDLEVFLEGSLRMASEERTSLEAFSIVFLAGCKSSLFSNAGEEQHLTLPDGLLHEAVRILGYEGGERRLGRHALVQPDESRVGVEVRALVDVDDTDRDGGGGLAWEMDASL